MSCPRKLRAFGRDLRDWIREAWPGYAGWEAGACWLIGKALREWIGPGAELWGVASKLGGGPYHAVIRVGDDCFLDVEGAWTEKQVLKWWAPGTGWPYVGLRPVAVDEEGVCSPYDVKDVVRALETTFGPGAAVLDWAKT